MKKYRPEFSEEIKSLERNSLWVNIIDILYNEWKTDECNVDKILSLGTELWYAILCIEYDLYDPRKVHTDDEKQQANEIMNMFQDILVDVTSAGFAYCNENMLFKCYFGYMMRVSQHLFITSLEDRVDWWERGTGLLRNSENLESDNPVIRAMYFEPDDSENEYLEACRLIWEKFTPEVWGNSRVQQYFFLILHGDKKYPDAYK